MKRKKLITLVVVLTLVVAGGVYFLVQDYSNQSQINTFRKELEKLDLPPVLTYTENKLGCGYDHKVGMERCSNSVKAEFAMNNRDDLEMAQKVDSAFTEGGWAHKQRSFSAFEFFEDLKTISYIKQLSDDQSICALANYKETETFYIFISSDQATCR